MNQHANNQAERRRHARIDHNIPLKISCQDADFVTETKNISCSGAYCRVDKYIEPMTKLKIHLLLPLKKNSKTTTVKVCCGGVVVRTESVSGDEMFDTAIFFNDIEQKDMRALAEFVDGLVGNNSSD